MRLRHFEVALVAGIVGVAPGARALPSDATATTESVPTSTTDRAGEGATAPAKPARDARSEIPIIAYTYTPRGAPAGAVGAQAYGLGLAASGQDAVLGGGGMVWWAPIDRLTLIVDASRNAWGKFSPSAAGMYRLLGGRAQRLTLGALGKFKVEGFAEGPDHDEVESEIELGALFGFRQAGWHFDANGIGGIGTAEDGEKDIEARLRLAYDLGRLVQLGLDGQARVRVDGPRYLPNGRTWDASGGTQVVIGTTSFFGSLTAGPTTQGLVTTSVGAFAILALGGTT